MDKNTYHGVNMTPIIDRNREHLIKLCKKYRVAELDLFGSAATDDFDEEKSDIDFLVDLRPGRSLFDLGGLLSDLQSLLKHNVDVVTTKGLRDRIRQRIIAEAVSL